MNTNPVVVGAVSGLNEQKVREATAKAQSIVSLILSEQATIKQRQACLKDKQAQLNELVAITPANLLGRELTGTGVITKAIAEVIEKQQKAQVEGPATRLAREIDDLLKAVEAGNKRITESREELSKIEADSVSVGEITGE